MCDFLAARIRRKQAHLVQRGLRAIFLFLFQHCFERGIQLLNVFLHVPKR